MLQAVVPPPPPVCSNERCPLEVNKQHLLQHEAAVYELRRFSNQ